MTLERAVPDPVTTEALGHVVGFAARLREYEVEVTLAETVEAAAALGQLDLSQGDSLYWGLRTCMVRRADDLARFDLAFGEYWAGLLDERPGRREEVGNGGGHEPAMPTIGEQTDSTTEPTRSRAGARTQGLATPEGEATLRATYSDAEVLRRKDFADYTRRDYQMLEQLLRWATFGGPWRVSRRLRANRLGQIDLRRTLQASLRTDGQPLRLLRRGPVSRPRCLTFVCDVSGSMDRYSRAILELAAVAARRRGHVEAFAFATRLTRLTAELTAGDLDHAIHEAISKTTDWAGGTRVGTSLERLNRDHPGAVRSSVVVVASDGWDLGDPTKLSAEAALLQRTAKRLVWVNPHLQDPRFEPRARGMAAALPFVDDFMPCHNFESFDTLLALLDTL